jgi:hypothetical protein
MLFRFGWRTTVEGPMLPSSSAETVGHRRLRDSGTLACPALPPLPRYGVRTWMAVQIKRGAEATHSAVSGPVASLSSRTRSDN